MKKRIIAIALALTLGITLTACGGGDGGSTASDSPSTGEDVYLTISTSASTSGLYTFYASIPDAVATVYPHIHITAMEGSGANSSNQAVSDGSAQIGAASSLANYNNYHGLDIFTEADPTIRTFINCQPSPVVMAVSVESGITNYSELDGQRICPGSTGSSTTTIFQSLADGLGIEPDWRPASGPDSLDAFSDRQNVGIGKSCSGNYDSLIVQMNASHPTDILSMTDEELNILIDAFPMMSEWVIPAGSYDFVDHDVTTVSFYASAVSSTAMDQQTGYEIFKALNEGAGREYINSAVPALENEDFIANTLADTEIPLHAGTVQYMVEKGIEVPESMIPPEYVPVSSDS